MGRLYEVHDVLSGAKTRMLWDGDELIAEFNGSNTLMRRYLHGASVDDPIASFESSGAPAFTNIRYLLADRQGSIVARAISDGSVQDRIAYDEYGVPLSPTSSQPMVGRFGYTGQAWIPELGLWHYKARFYSPTLGRFMQVDPIGYEDQVNLYAYVGNDPMNAFDPTGMAEFYFGGGADGYGTNIVKEYANNRGKFYMHFQRDKAMNDIRAAAANGEKIVIVGHSWGGYSAATVAGNLIDEGIQPDLLITIDPVGELSDQTLDSLGEREGLWANISALPKDADSMTMGDTIAGIGVTSGPFGFGLTDTSGADVQLTSEAHHEQFGTMMDELSAPEMICGVDPKSGSCGGK